MFWILFLILTLTENRDFFPVEDISRGMKGIGLTSFSGVKIDTFDVEIIGVLRGVGTGHTIILARLESKLLKHTGVLAGMSGSPVYIDNKLLGAVAYSWSFSKDPICGITPAQEMKEMVSTYGQVRKVSPLRSILSVSGVGLSPYIDSIAGMFNLDVVPSGKDTGEGSLIPGSPAGLVLVDGDGVIALMGTLTFVEGKKLYSFGHPALMSGNAELPFATGRVSGLLPSMYSSFKFITPLKIIGTTVWDGATGVIAEIGRKPSWIYFKMRVGKKEFNYKIAEYPTIFSYLVSSLLFSGVAEQLGGDFEGTVKSLSQINVEFNDKDFNIRLPLYLAGRGLHRALTFYLGGITHEILLNRKGKMNIRNIEIDIQPMKGVRLYNLKNISLSKDEVCPGEGFFVRVLFSRYRKPDTTITFKLNAPPIEGDYTVCALDAASLYRTLNDKAFSDPENPLKFLKTLQNFPSNNVLSVIIVSSEKTINGSETILPISKRIVARDILSSGNRVYVNKRLKMDGEIKGIVRKSLKVKRRD